MGRNKNIYNEYIKSTQGYMKMCTLWIGALYIQAKIMCTVYQWGGIRPPFIDRDLEVSFIDRDLEVSFIDRDLEVSFIDRDLEVSFIDSDLEVSL